MATTRPELAWAVLDALAAAQFPFAVLHGEGRVSHGDVSGDVDVAVGVRLSVAIPDLIERLRGRLHLVMVFPYDLASASTFWATPDGLDGCQIDLLHDPDGRGRYGLRTDEALAIAIPGSRWRRLDDETSRCYLISKRWLKRDVEKLAALCATGGFPVAAQSCFTPAAQRRVRRAINGHQPPWRPALFWRPVSASAMRRYVRRAQVPCGYVLRVDGIAVGLLNDAAARFGQFLIRVRVRRATRWGQFRARLDSRRPFLTLLVGGEGNRSIDEVVTELRVEMERDTTLRLNRVLAACEEPQA